jgi:hypothetical protein
MVVVLFTLALVMGAGWSPATTLRFPCRTGR